jgi:hypothetical protein
VGYVRWSVIGLVALTAWAVCRVYSRLLANTRTFRAHGRAPQEGPLHRVCAALHGLGTAYLLLHWAVQHLQQLSSSALLRIRVALGVLGVRSALLDFLLRAAAAVDWLVLLPRIVLGLHGAAALLAVGALMEGRFRLPRRDRSVQLALLLHVYFSAANIVAMFLGPVHGTALFIWVVVGTLFVQSYQQMLHAAGLSVTAEKNSPGAAPGLGAYLPLVALALYFPLSGRFLFFSTAHRMDFGTLQVRGLTNPLLLLFSLSIPLFFCRLAAVGGLRRRARLPLRLRGCGAGRQHLWPLRAGLSRAARLRAVRPAQGRHAGPNEGAGAGGALLRPRRQLGQKRGCRRRQERRIPSRAVVGGSCGGGAGVSERDRAAQLLRGGHPAQAPDGLEGVRAEGKA